MLRPGGKLAVTFWEADAFQYHPLVNTSTLTIKQDALKRFLEKEGHTYRIIEVPSAIQA